MNGLGEAGRFAADINAPSGEFPREDSGTDVFVRNSCEWPVGRTTIAGRRTSPVTWNLSPKRCGFLSRAIDRQLKKMQADCEIVMKNESESSVSKPFFRFLSMPLSRSPPLRFQLLGVFCFSTSIERCRLPRQVQGSQTMTVPARRQR